MVVAQGSRGQHGGGGGGKGQGVNTVVVAKGSRGQHGGGGKRVKGAALWWW